MRKLIVLGTVPLVLALELQAHRPPVWGDLPVPVPTFALDGTLDGMAASSPFWRNYFLYADDALSGLKDDGFSTYSVHYDGQDALLTTLDSEQIEISDASCFWLSRGTRLTRYDLWAQSELAFVDLTRTDCKPCLTNPNGAGCEPCLTRAEGVQKGGGLLERGTLDARLYRIEGGYHIDELENLVVRYRYVQNDRANCAGQHSHKPGLGMHIGTEKHSSGDLKSDWSLWYLMSALRSGTVTVSTPPADPVTPTVDPVEVARLQTRIDSLFDALGGRRTSSKSCRQKMRGSPRQTRTAKR